MVLGVCFIPLFLVLIILTAGCFAKMAKEDPTMLGGHCTCCITSESVTTRAWVERQVQGYQPDKGAYVEPNPDANKIVKAWNKEHGLKGKWVDPEQFVFHTKAENEELRKEGLTPRTFQGEAGVYQEKYRQRSRKKTKKKTPTGVDEDNINENQ